MGDPRKVSSVDGASLRGCVELNRYVRREPWEGQEGLGGNGHGLSEENESKNKDAENQASGTSVEQSGVTPKPLPGTYIRWERFLPVKTLKVLLVENDNSTRHVVSALLQNCSYEVIAVETGLQAWKVLEDLTNHIDLILTEVAMPGLSGIGLLNRIMYHKTCKNIPVIMMSSNDSMGTVFKCLSRGAVDFLVKPIRKNELKNLWQHVWRRCHSSSGSGSESGIQTQKKNKSKSADESNDSSSDSEEEDIGSTGLNARDGSDSGSGAQSSWTKRAVDVDSQAMSPSDQLANPADSTCAQVIHPKSSCCVELLPEKDNSYELRLGQKSDHDDLMGKDLAIGVPWDSVAEHKAPRKHVPCKISNSCLQKIPEVLHRSETVVDGGAQAEASSRDLIGSVAENTEVQGAERTTGIPNSPASGREVHDKYHDSLVEPSLELRLKRLRSAEGAPQTHDERVVLRRSDSSAFTRYHSTAFHRALTQYGGNCSTADSSSDALKADSTPNVNSNSNPANIEQGSNGSSNSNFMGSTTKKASTKPATNKEKLSSPSAFQIPQHPSAFHPVKLQNPSFAKPAEGKNAELTTSATTDQPKEFQHQIRVQHHHHHHYHHHHHHVHTAHQSLDQCSQNNTNATRQCGSSNVCDPLMESQAANYSVNGSNSGSNHGSVGQNGSTTVANAGGTNMENTGDLMENHVAADVDAKGNINSDDVYQNRLTQREVALNKFRQKRKERNFGKKVRYYSRKKLAEQRPRVRGQFVRRSAEEQANKDDRTRP